MTVDPVSLATTGPTVVSAGAGNAYNYGAAAVVSNGQIVVFTSGQSRTWGVTSTDGKNYNSFLYETNNGLKDFSVLDAIAFEPSGTDPESVMLVYNDPLTSPATLGASVFSFQNDSGFVLATQDFTLPWPSASPSWQPVAQGNLLLGTNGGFNGTAAGARSPCLQFYASTTLNGEMMNEGRWEYNLAQNGWTFTDITYQVSPGPFSKPISNMAVLPWFDTIDQVKGTMKMSHVVVYWERLGTSYSYPAPSDWMVPQNNDPAYGWAGTPTPTGNAPLGSQLRQLWTLVGVILGPPPFPMNDAANACVYTPEALSWVGYGQGTSATVTTTSTMSNVISVGVGATIKGLGGVGYSGSLDIAYAHAWTSSHSNSTTTSVSNTFEFSPCFEPAGSQGTHGWAIFNAPTTVTQWYKLYAYDYDPSSGGGTYLDEDIYATSFGSSTLQFAYFDLANPSAGEYSGLFTGIPAYPNSTDLAGWHSSAPEWDNGGSDWTATFGDKTSPAVSVLGLGAKDEETYTNSTTTMTSNGNSNSIDVSASAGYTWPIGGYKVGVSLSAGYDREWTTTTENDTTVTDSVSFGLNVPIPPDTPGYVNSLTVQPYLLQATSPHAPWIPTGYDGNLPWCITWGVVEYGTVGVGMAGRVAGPASASGTIRHGDSREDDEYALSGGHMSWLPTNGGPTSMPLTADQFDPSKGASVSLNGHVFSTKRSNGHWSRHGDVWSYETARHRKRGPHADDQFSLALNFAAETWSFSSSARMLDEEIRSGDGSVSIQLSVEGRYTFTSWLGHGVKERWSHEEKRWSSRREGVEEIEGEWNSNTGRGSTTLRGRFPHESGGFGDVGIRLNGVKVDFPLLSTPGFRKALEARGRVEYRAEGLSFVIDLGTRKWHATVEESQFKGGMAPRDGVIRVELLLGGKRVSDQTLTLERWKTALTYPYTTPQ